METLGEFADGLERESFVGREDELRWFRRWLTGEREDIAILTVLGHGGVGKTALLRRFAAMAEERPGLEVRFLDAHVVEPSVAGLVAALEADSLDAAVTQIDSGSVLLIDSLDVAPGLVYPLFDGLLPRLAMPARVVVGARHRPQEGDQRLRRVTHALRLQPFTDDESRRYLQRRGISEASAVDEVLAAASGSPLATSIAADVVARQPAAMLGSAGDWQQTLRSLTERLLRGLQPSVRRLVEAAAVVRQFDESLLADMVDEQTVEKDFAHLARLSMVRPADRGLRLHDDVREIISSDLRSRRPIYIAELRDRAIRCYRRRLSDPDPREREWFVNERLYLWEHDFIRTSLFPAAGAEEYGVEDARPEDRDEIVALWREFGDTGAAAQGGAPTDDVTVEEVETLIGHPGSHFKFAVDSSGRRRAVGLSLRIAQDTLAVLPAVVRPLAQAEFSDPAVLPQHASASPYRYLGPIVAAPFENEAMARLARWAIGSWIHGGVILVASTMSRYVFLMETLGFTRIDLDGEVRGRPVHGAKLVLEGGDVEQWIDRITAALPPPEVVTSASGAEAPVIAVLGGFSVSCGGRDVTPSRVTAGAVKHVVAEGGALHVETLIDRLWPEADVQTGRVRLRGLLRRLREVSGEVLVRDGDTIRLAESVEVDALQFTAEVERAVRLVGGDPARARGLLGSALARYEGDLLPGDPYVDEFGVLRERLRRLLITAWDTDATAAAALGDVEDAVLALDRAIELDPYDEGRCVQAARLLHDRGEPGRAARYLRRARSISEELGLPLSRAFVDLERDLYG